jgi:hypothetical protein
MQYGIRFLLVIVALVASANFILFVASPIVRVSVLFAIVLLMPVPLFVLLRHGGQKVQLFAAGGLIAYAIWLILGGLPCAGMIAYRFLQGARQPVQHIEFLIDGNYAGYVGLYAPWLIVPLAGELAVIVHWLVHDRS